MFSGKNGKLLYTFTGDTIRDNFGFSVTGLRDVNRDGYADVAVGAPQPNYPASPGYVRVFSGADGKPLATFRGFSNDDGFGYSVSGAGDVDRDGHPDILVGAPQLKSKGRGYAGVLSGRTGAILHGFVGTSTQAGFGFSVDGGVDVNGDNYPDLLIGAPGAGSKNTGGAYAMSGKDGTSLIAPLGDSTGDRFGCAVAGIGDVNNDGYGDFVVGADGDDDGGTDCGRVRVVSGANGNALYTFDGDSAGDAFGRSVSGIGWMTYGWLDFVVGAPGDDNVGTSSGSARVLSGRPRTLWTDKHELSLKRPGTQQLNLAAGVAHASRYYQMLGSFSGSRPGFRYAGVHIPLEFDPYTVFSFQNSNSTVLSRFRGKLDGRGNATASFRVPPGLPPLVDFTLWHAFVVHDAGGVLHMASNPTTLRLAN